MSADIIFYLKEERLIQQAEFSNLFREEGRERQG